ncbi:hypothetical protein [Streptomyces sp. NPDC046942]|uniref:hypothetical protein n=1 Tax=Streptomyces sp. NPDC046942 TaxID=3155137 RepID=UPI0033C27165
MFGRRQKVALALTAVLTAAAACTNHARQQSADPATGAAARGVPLVASGDVLPHTSVIDRAAYDGAGRG